MRHEAVTWLDLRADDLLRARGFIRSLQDEGVIDELGFLALQERFSDLLHPATTTLMRAARYFYFVAGIYKSLEAEGVRSAQVAKRARQRQDELRNILSATETVGVIGRDAGIDLVQLPSHIYWSGLRKLEIFRSALSESAYHDQFEDIRRSRRGYRDDDNTAQQSSYLQYWADDLPPARFLDSKKQVKPGETFKLTKEEASDLYERFTSKFPNSLLAHMLENRLAGMKWPWDCPKAPVQLGGWLEHARNMSLFVRGATLQYYGLLIEELDRRGIQAASDSLRPVFDKWWAEARDRLKTWNINEFVTIPTVTSALRRGDRGDIWFINSWRERCTTSSTAGTLFSDPKARELIRERERFVKPSKSRLKYEKHLKQWKPDRVSEGIYQFNYRHSIGSKFVEEILDGLKRRQ